MYVRVVYKELCTSARNTLFWRLLINKPVLDKGTWSYLPASLDHRQGTVKVHWHVTSSSQVAEETAWWHSRGHSGVWIPGGLPGFSSRPWTLGNIRRATRQFSYPSLREQHPLVLWTLDPPARWAGDAGSLMYLRQLFSKLQSLPEVSLRH